MVIQNVEVQAACAALGYREENTYYKEPDCLETVKDLIRFLKREDDSCDIRRDLGESQIVQNDLIPIVKQYAEERILLETVIRLLVNLTQPARLCFQNHVPEDKTNRNYFMQIEGHLQSYKESFTDEELFAVLTKKLGSLLQLDYEHRQEEDRILIERILLLIRNVLHIPPNPVVEQRTEDDASIHDQVLWAIHTSGMEDLLLYLASSKEENQFILHVLEIITLMFREQTSDQIACAGIGRSATEKERDERELIMAREQERAKKRTQILKYNTRHSRFGGTYTVSNMKSITERDLIYHRPLSKANEITFDHNKVPKKTPKNRVPITGREITRTSTLSIRLFLREFCLQFLENCYNPLMKAVKDALNRSKAQENDETYYMWAVRFFMEVNRKVNFRVDLVGETLSVPAFHYIQTQLQLYHEMLMTNKKEGLIWSRRMHLALKAYHELLMNLYEMDRSKDAAIRESAKVIEGNVFYMMEYRDSLLLLLRKFDETRQSRAFLKDLVEITHLFLKMLGGYCKKNRHLMVQRKKKKGGKKKKTRPATAPSAPEVTEEQRAEQWDLVSGDLSAILQGRGQMPEGVTPFDAASQVDMEQQRIDAVFRIQESLRNNDAGSALALFRAAREVWPDRPEFGQEGISVEEEFMALREIFMTNLPSQARSQEDAAGAPEEEEEADEGVVEEEFGEEAVMTTEQEFDFKEFVSRFASPHVVKPYVLLLQDFTHNSVHTNHCAVKMLHRIAFDLNLPGMLFQMRLFRIFQKVLLDPTCKVKLFEEFAGFAKHMMRKFFEAAQSNPKIFVELFFWKSTKESVELLSGYGSYSDRSRHAKVAWTEEQDEEIKRLFEEFNKKQEEDPDPGADLGDYIVENLIDSTKTRRQVVRELVHLDLIGSAKDLKRSKGSGRPRGWREEEELEIRQLYDEFKDSLDPVGDIMNNMTNKRSKPAIMKKLLEMGVVSDKRELYKKRSKNPSKKKRSAQDWLEENEIEDVPIPSDRDEGKSDASEDEAEMTEISSGSESDSSDDGNDRSEEPQYILKIRRAARKVFEKGMEAAVTWLKRCLCRTADDREEDGDDESIPIVPITDDQEDAMENKEFQALLKAVGITAPANEQERFWRIPSRLKASDLRSRSEALAPSSGSEEKPASAGARYAKLKELVKKKKENTASEKRKRRALKKSPPKPRESPAEQNRGSPSTSDALIHLDSSDDEVSKSQVASEDVSSQRRSSGVKRPLLCDSDSDDDDDDDDKLMIVEDEADLPSSSLKKRAKVILDSDDEIGDKEEEETESFPHLHLIESQSDRDSDVEVTAMKPAQKSQKRATIASDSEDD